MVESASQNKGLHISKHVLCCSAEYYDFMRDLMPAYQERALGAI